MHPYLFFIVYAVLFYAIIRLVAKDRDLSLWTVIFWLIGVVAGRWLVTFLAASIGVPEIPAAIVGEAAALGILIFILWHQGYSGEQIATIGVLIGVVHAAKLLAYVL